MIFKITPEKMYFFTEYSKYKSKISINIFDKLFRYVRQFRATLFLFICWPISFVAKLYFVNTEMDSPQIRLRPDLVFKNRSQIPDFQIIKSYYRIQINNFPFRFWCTQNRIFKNVIRFRFNLNRYSVLPEFQPDFTRIFWKWSS